MKKIIYLSLFLFLVVNLTFAQERAPDSKPDKELTCDEAAIRIQEWQAVVKDLQNKLNETNANIGDLTKQLELAVINLKNCNDDIRKILGINDLDIEKFRQALGVIEAKVRDLKRLSNDELADRRDEVEALENQLNELRKNKISLLPEFYNKIIDLAKQIRSLYKEKKITTYTVGTWSEDRDCLWNIAGKIEIYGDPFLWPKIWQSNTSIVRNPDIIHPGQVLTLPPKGPKDSEELKAERRYWRKKIEERREQEESAPTGKTGE